MNSLSLSLPLSLPLRAVALWIITILSVALAGLMAFAFIRLHPRPETSFTVGLSMLTTYGAMCENPQSRLPINSHAAKVSRTLEARPRDAICRAAQSTSQRCSAVQSTSQTCSTVQPIAEQASQLFYLYAIFFVCLV